MALQTGLIKSGDDFPGVFISGEMATSLLIPALKAMMNGKATEEDRTACSAMITIMEKCRSGEAATDVGDPGLPSAVDELIDMFDLKDEYESNKECGCPKCQLFVKLIDLRSKAPTSRRI